MRFIMALFALLAFLGSAVTSAGASPVGKRIAVLATSDTNPYIAAWTSTFTKLATGMGMKVTELDSNYDVSRQSQYIDDAIAQKYDLILICNENDQAIVPALTRAKAAGVPVILWTTPIDKKYDDLFVSYIGSDHTQLGEFAAENLVEGLQKEGKTKAQVIAVTGIVQQILTRKRMEGFNAILAKSPGIKLVASEDGKWSTAISEKVTSEMLVRMAARGGVDGIFAMADIQATGAIQAVKSAGIPLGLAGKGIVVVASNCMKDGITHIRSGEQYATATQIPTLEAQITARKVAAFFNGEKLQKYEIVKAYSITKANVDQFANGCSY